MCQSQHGTPFTRGAWQHERLAVEGVARPDFDVVAAATWMVASTATATAVAEAAAAAAASASAPTKARSSCCPGGTESGGKFPLRRRYFVSGPPEMRNLMASGPQRSGEIMETTLSSTLEPVPGPFACQGSPADGDDARQGPFWFFQK